MRLYFFATCLKQVLAVSNRAELRPTIQIPLISSRAASLNK